jgi:hypothetical protein
MKRRHMITYHKSKIANIKAPGNLVSHGGSYQSLGCLAIIAENACDNKDQKH